MKRWITVFLISLTFMVGNASPASLELGPNHPTALGKGPFNRVPEFAPGELVVKFHPEWGEKFQDLTTSREKLQMMASDPVFSYITMLNRQWDLRGMRRLIGKYETGQARTTKEFFSRSVNRFSSRGARSPKALKIFDLENLYLLEFSPEFDVLEAARQYSQAPGVEYAEPNLIYRAQLVPNDPFYHSSGSWEQPYRDLWGLYKIQAEGAWDWTTGSREIVVAVTDTGVDLDHEDLAANIWINSDEIAGNGIDDDENGYIDDVVGWDFVNSDNDPTDDVGHGSHVAGTIAATGNNGVGVVGVTWNSRIMPVKGLGLNGGTTEMLVNALTYAADNGADIINCSWGGYNSGPMGRAIHEAIHYAYRLGCVIVAAAGNSTDDVLDYGPAAFEEVITVAATNQADRWCDFSNWGYKIDVSAPGGDSGFIQEDGRIDFSKSNILSLRADDIDIYRYEETPGYFPGTCVVGEHYYRLLGTSMAAPHVSGVVALILSLHPEYTAEEVRRILWAGADDVDKAGWDIFSGHGRVNANRSLSLPPPSSLPLAEIAMPTNGETVTTPTVTIRGTAHGPNFTHYILEWGYGELPYEWVEIYRSSTPVVSGPLFEWDPTGTMQGYGIIKLTVYSSDIKPFTIFRPCRIANNMLPGWPQRMINIWSRPAIADLDRDGEKEIIIAGSTELYVYRRDGTVVQGWPRAYSSYSKESTSAVAVGDIDEDKDLEIVIAANGHFGYSNTGKVLVWHHNGNYARGWPKTVEPTRSSPAIGDIDGDGRNEIVVPVSTGNVYAWRGSGELLPGWPVIRSETSMDYVYQSGAALADIDGDGDLEIFVGSNQPDGAIYAWHHNATPVEGWPIQVSSTGFFRTPVVGDIDRDGKAEIISALVLSGGESCSIYVWRTDGSLVPGWPKHVPAQADEVALADIDGDGDLEIFASTEMYYDSKSTFYYSGSVQAWHHDGTPLRGWPVRTSGVPAMDTPLIADIDGDGDLEVIAGTAESYYAPRQGKLYIWHADGTSVAGWPFFSGWNVFSAPALGDVDRDGKMDMVVAAFLSATTDVYVFGNLGAYNPSNVEWGTYRGDLGLKGVYVDPATIPRAILEVSPLRLDFTGVENGSNPSPKTFSIFNSGSDVLHWQASPNVPWITVAPSEGIDPSTPSVYVNLSGMEPGTYRGEITIRGDSYAQNSPQVVAVSLEVISSIPLLKISSNRFEFQGIYGGENPPQQKVYITNPGLGSLQWTAETSQSWVQISSSSGTAPSTMDISVDMRGLSIGTHSGRITVTGLGNVRNSPQTIDILLRVREPNRPPFAPAVPSGLGKGIAGTEYRCSTATTDPDGDPIRYVFDWGDGLTTNTQWVNSGQVVTEGHTWTNTGTYAVWVKAIDQKGAESPWSSAHSVIISPATINLVTTERADAYIDLGTYLSQRIQAQSFVALGANIQKVSVALAKLGIPWGEINLSLRDSLTGSDLFRTSIKPSQVKSVDVYNPTWVEIVLDSPLNVVQGKTYYLILTSYGSASNAYRVSCNRQNPYSGGMLFAGTKGSPVTTYDVLMKVVFGAGIPSREE